MKQMHERLTEYGYGLGNNLEKSVDIGFFSGNSKKFFIEN